MSVSKQTLTDDEVQQAARILAKHGLGICIPHMHDGRTGEIIPLPSGVVACERDLQITFEKIADAQGKMTPVAWRWNAGELEVCANCCTGPSQPEAL